MKNSLRNTVIAAFAMASVTQSCKYKEGRFYSNYYHSACYDNLSKGREVSIYSNALRLDTIHEIVFSGLNSVDNQWCMHVSSTLKGVFDPVKVDSAVKIFDEKLTIPDPKDLGFH